MGDKETKFLTYFAQYLALAIVALPDCVSRYLIGAKNSKCYSSKIVMFLEPNLFQARGGGPHKSWLGPLFFCILAKINDKLNFTL